MPQKKRKKYPKLPNGFGSIRYLGSDRRNCYAVHPPSTIDELGVTKRPAAICYVDDWIKGFTVLTAYKAGTYIPGMEKDLPASSTQDADVLVQRILADYSTLKGVEDKHPEIHEPTFEEVFKKFIVWKFENPHKEKKLSKASRTNYQVAFKNCKALHHRIFCKIKPSELQANLDSCTLSHSSQELILTLYKQMYKYAAFDEICTDDKSKNVVINIPDDDKHGIPFSDDELTVLWKNRSDEEVQMILIMIYSGYRISAYKTLEVNLEENYFKGGVKTAAGKGRIVPIHPAIRSFVSARIQKYGTLLPVSASTYRTKYFNPTLERLNVKEQFNHTPHDCRHTFSMLCEKYSVRENDRKRMLGHSFQKDITNKIYGHRSIEDLDAEIKKIKIPEFVTNCD